MKFFKIYLVLFLFSSCQINHDLDNNFFNDFSSEKVLSDDIHSAFADAVFFRGIKLVSYRAGLTHASDKGIIKIINLKTQKHIEIKDELFDLRNGYFLIENDKLFFYCSVFDHESSKFKTLYKYEIILTNTNLKSKFIGNEEYHQAYHPHSTRLGAWSIKKEDHWLVFPEKKESLLLDDEEVSFIEINNELIGIGRNHKKVGLPLLLFFKDKSGWVVKDWCYQKEHVAIVSPKLYKYNGEIILTYTERKVDYFINLYKFKITNYEESITKIKYYKTYNDLISCNAYNSKTIYSGNDIDAGYPALIFDDDKIFLYTYEKENNKTSVIERVFKYF